MISRFNAALFLCATWPLGLFAQSLTTLFNFDAKNGSIPGSVVQTANGDLYGTTYYGGINGGIAFSGSVFKVTPGGTLATLYSFCAQSGCPDGQSPVPGLIRASNGEFYGVTQSGGAYANCYTPNGEHIGCGTIFKITPAGALTTLYSFCRESKCGDGSVPAAGLVQATNGDLYGTTSQGAGGCGAHIGCGTIFKITLGGAFTILHRFTCPESGPCPDGAMPLAPLIQARDGNLYGTTSGTIFRMTPGGSLTTLYTFCVQTGCPDGTLPTGLVQAMDGDFYGTTSLFGAYGYGTAFKVTPTGGLTTLYSFCAEAGCADGAYPAAPLLQATDGNLYGTTSSSGANGFGTIFKIAPTGTLTTLYSFCSLKDCADGADPGALIQGANGSLYGSTGAGGVSNRICAVGQGGCGTIFSFSTGGTLSAQYRP